MHLYLYNHPILYHIKDHNLNPRSLILGECHRNMLGLYHLIIDFCNPRQYNKCCHSILIAVHIEFRN